MKFDVILQDSKDELEIVSTNFEIDDNDDCLESIHDADKKAVNIAKLIIQLKQNLDNLKNVCIYFVDNLNVYKQFMLIYYITQDCGPTTSNDMEVCKVQEQLIEMVAHYKKLVAKVLKLAKSNNFDLENLECQKIDIAQHTNPNNCMSSVVKASVRYTFLIILKEYTD